jgi:uncharacterized membrane protein
MPVNPPRRNTLTDDIKRNRRTWGAFGGVWLGILAGILAAGDLAPAGIVLAAAAGALAAWTAR